MAKRDDEARLVRLGPAEVLMVELARIAMEGVDLALRVGGYSMPLTEERCLQLARATREAADLALALAGDSAISDEQLEHGMRLAGVEAVVRLLGAPPAASPEEVASWRFGPN